YFSHLRGHRRRELSFLKMNICHLDHSKNRIRKPFIGNLMRLFFVFISTKSNLKTSIFIKKL
ncbi:MAG: hypothetical protein ACI4RM_00025, partial [Ruminococcus sp.]